ncbi:MAG: hypothetical protein OHK0056_02950 [Bacteriovoracaceae bacterium]
MSAYEIDLKRLKNTKPITDEKELIKLQLASAFLKATAMMESQEILEVTGLHKADLSRIRTMNLDRFSIDRLISLLGVLGFTTTVAIKPKKRASHEALRF